MTLPLGMVTSDCADAAALADPEGNVFAVYAPRG